MKREQTLRRRFESLSTLSAAVSAMKSLSGHHFRATRGALAPARAYREGVDGTMASIGIGAPPPTKAPAAVLLVAADLGLCGSYTSRLAQEAIAQYRNVSGARLYCVGSRSQGALKRAGLATTRLYRAPTGVDGLMSLLLVLADEVLNDYLSEAFGVLYVVSGRFEGVGSFRPVVSLVLPVTPVAKTVPLRPSEYVSELHLAEIAIREFLYITLFELLLDALASEHGMRIVATEAAGEWLRARISSTERQIFAVRREEATQEVLDIASGARLRRRSS
jgi:F-type H+-transporting ATPase subunit gamma